jgi:hypothetical protein
VVFFELWAIAHIRTRYMDTPFLQPSSRSWSACPGLGLGNLIRTDSHRAAVCIAADSSGIAGEFATAMVTRVQALVLHALVLKTALTGWLLASFRG